MRQSIAPRLLVADDDQGVIAAYRLVLEATGKAHKPKHPYGDGEPDAELFGDSPPAAPPWRITFADQGEDAVEAVRCAITDGDPYAAIFLDVRMPPGIDGYEAAEQIRRLDPTIHIVIVSGYCDYSYQDFLEIAGPVGQLTVLTKPVWPQELRQLAMRLTAGHSH